MTELALKDALRCNWTVPIKLGLLSNVELFCFVFAVSSIIHELFGLVKLLTFTKKSHNVQKSSLSPGMSIIHSGEVGMCR